FVYSSIRHLSHLALFPYTTLFRSDYLAEFGKDFAEFASPAVVPVDVVDREFQARYAFPHGDKPTIEEFQTRFPGRQDVQDRLQEDRKSTRLNSSHGSISYAVFCLK